MEIFTVSLVVVCIILFCVCIILFCVNVAEGKKLKDTKRLVELEEDVAKSLAHEYEKKKIEYEHKVSRSKELDEEYSEKQKILQNNFDNLSRLHAEKTKNLQEHYDLLEQDLNGSYNQNKIEIEEKINEIHQELESLKKQKSAVIQALQKEQEMREKKDLYRLNIPEADLNDIKLLRSIQYKLTNQRVLCMLIWQTFFAPVAKEKFKFIIGDNTVCGIYKITNILNNKVYIGQAKDIKKRLQEHMKCGLGIDCPANNKLYDAIKENGLENFTFEVLEECPAEDLNKKEKYYIEFYNSVSWGYNSQYGNRSLNGK